MSDFDQIENGINTEVDRAMSGFKNNPDMPPEETIPQEDVVERISRIANEIQQVVPLILPKRNSIESQELIQDPIVAKAAKGLLLAQVDRLKALIGRLDQ